MRFEKHDKIIFIGDSITDCGRKQPIGEGKDNALGTGYVALTHALLQSAYPELSLRIINMGIGGNTSRHLKERWDRDVIDLKPDWVSVMIGINDVWRQYDRPTITEEHVYIDEYRENLEHIVQRTMPLVKGMIMMTPFYIENDPNDEMLRSMNQYGQVVKEVAEKNNAIFVDTQQVFNPLLEHMYPAAIAWDRVHTNLTGHMAIARAFLQAIGFDR